MRITNLEVDTKKLKENFDSIQAYVGEDVTVMPVVKANGYGTNITLNADFMNEFNIVAVALYMEAYELRKNGYKNDIFVLNQPYIDEVVKCEDSKIIFGVCDLEFVQKLNETEKVRKVHLEIDSGMGRTGINPAKFQEFCKNVKNSENIIVEGIYTHLSSADCDDEYTKEQLEKFEVCVEIAKSEFKDLKYIHASASNGILNYKKSFYNLVRPGIILYGYESFEGACSKLELKPVCTLKSKITFLKEVEADTSIGYSRKFITKNKSKIATIPIGYADGLPRALSNKGYVVINGKKAPILGNICMDNIMVDVTNIENVFVGTDVYIWDNNIIKIEDIAQNDNTINYEIISRISQRVPRIFI